jgi:hypothetical protein
MSHHAERNSLNYRFGLVLLAFLAIGALLLFSEHQAHVLGAALWLAVLACPILHLFMHGDHGGHGSRSSGHASDGKHPEQQR